MHAVAVACAIDDRVHFSGFFAFRSFASCDRGPAHAHSQFVAVDTHDLDVAAFRLDSHVRSSGNRLRRKASGAGKGLLKAG